MPSGIYSQIYEDLAFLGLEWSGEPTRQSDRLPAYDRALQTLRDMDLVYPCYLTRAELALYCRPRRKDRRPRTVSFPTTSRHAVPTRG